MKKFNWRFWTCVVGGVLNFGLFRVADLADADTSIPALTVVVFTIGAILSLKTEE